MNIKLISIENRLLRKERNGLPLSDKDRINEINKKLIENYKIIKDACEAIGKRTTQGGNYTWVD